MSDSPLLVIVVLALIAIIVLVATDESSSSSPTPAPNVGLSVPESNSQIMCANSTKLTGDTPYIDLKVHTYVSSDSPTWNVFACYDLVLDPSHPTTILRCNEHAGSDNRVSNCTGQFPNRGSDVTVNTIRLQANVYYLTFVNAKEANDFHYYYRPGGGWPAEICWDSIRNNGPTSRCVTDSYVQSLWSATGCNTTSPRSAEYYHTFTDTQIVQDMSFRCNEAKNLSNRHSTSFQALYCCGKLICDTSLLTC